MTEDDLRSNLANAESRIQDIEVDNNILVRQVDLLTAEWDRLTSERDLERKFKEAFKAEVARLVAWQTEALADEKDLQGEIASLRRKLQESERQQKLDLDLARQIDEARHFIVGQRDALASGLVAAEETISRLTVERNRSMNAASALEFQTLRAQQAEADLAQAKEEIRDLRDEIYACPEVCHTRRVQEAGRIARLKDRVKNNLGWYRARICRLCRFQTGRVAPTGGWFCCFENSDENRDGAYPDETGSCLRFSPR